MIKACCLASVGRMMAVLLLASGCHLDRVSETTTLSELTSPSLSQALFRFRPVPFFLSAAHTPPALQLVSRLEQEAAHFTIPAEPLPSAAAVRPDSVTTLPPLAFVSHLSSFLYITPDNTLSAEQYTLDPFSLTPSSPALFDDADPSGQGLGLDMGLTSVDLPLDGALEWAVAVQAYCACPQSHGLYQAPDARARLDFATGRFRLSAGFGDDKALRSIAMDIALDRDRLVRRAPHPAAAELGFQTGGPMRLPGDLSVYLSGRSARHIGGEFLSATPQEMALSDILFVMQFAGSAGP